MDFPTNPFAILTFISAPAVLTNASCVLLFGTGNRYGRAVDRVHELWDVVEKVEGLEEAELRLRIRQLEAAETRTLLIVRGLTCFYTAVAGFVTSTLVSLIGGVLVSVRIDMVMSVCFALAFIAGALGVVAMIAGATLLARETRFSFQVLREEKNFITERCMSALSGLRPQPAKRHRANSPHKRDGSTLWNRQCRESTRRIASFCSQICRQESSN